MPLSEHHAHAEASEKPESVTRQRSRLLSWSVLGGYCLYLVSRNWLQQDQSRALPVWTPQDTYRILEWIGNFIVACISDCIAFIPIGFFATLAVFSRLEKPLIGVLKFFGILIFTVFIVEGVQCLEHRQTWPVMDITGLILPLFGCVMGIGLGRTWLRGYRARLWLLPKIVLVGIFIGILIGGGLWLSVEAKPLPFKATPVTSAEKRRLVDLMRGKSPTNLTEGQTQTLQLTEHDMDVLLAWGLSLGLPNSKGEVALSDDSVSIQTSAGVNPWKRGVRYLNLAVAGHVKIDREQLCVHLEGLKIGGVEVPRWVLNLLSPVVTEVINKERLFQPFLNVTHNVQIEPGMLSVTYGALNLSSRFREELFEPMGIDQAVRNSTQVQVENLYLLIHLFPDVTPHFETCVEAAFSLAHVRSAYRDPIVENRAAILALGILLGHERVAEFIGFDPADRDHRKAQKIFGQVELRGRSDWTKHFWVSAAMTILSDKAISHAAGLLKEELDSDIGGSGFSFGDLLADRAGTTFAMCATRDQAAARAMQQRFTYGCNLDEIFPYGADLPEGMTDAELHSRFGGVGGTGYLRLIKEIERRIAACEAYQ